MAKIETAVHDQFAKGAEASNTQNTTQSGAQSAGGPQALSGAALEPPFARVNTVAPGSPAASAGLQVGDKVTRFGIVNFTNHERLSKISQVVQQNQNVRNHLCLCQRKSLTESPETYSRPRVKRGIGERSID